MSGSLLQRAEAIFVELAELSRDAWEPRLRDRCGGDLELMREVSSLLECHAQSATFLDASELAELRPFDFDSSLDEEELPPGARIDEFVVQGLLGRGGMGNVYVAQQDKPRRTVALKVIRRGLATAALLRRFEHEAELLGRLHHPGIAQIYAAGTALAPSPDGQPPTSQPFIAMELVNGPPLHVYARDQRLTAGQCMGLVAMVCDAVHHAHQRGVIHRDLKPGNILVDERGHPRILDFGVARTADADRDAATMHTRVGQIIGTLPYMSPEQVLGDASEVDTRTDVYALGVVLYQLLAGRLPLDVSGTSIAEAARMIRDETPARLGQVDRSMRGDIETIAARAIEKDKSRRYQSAADLADDLRRYIAGKPVLARQDSALYVIRKQINRHKGAVASAVILILGTFVFAVHATYQARANAALAHAQEQEARRAELARDEADRQRSRADSAAGRLEKELSASTIERGRLLARGGNLAGAENLLWPEHLRNLDSRHSFYALWELYSRQRCEATLLVNAPRAVKMRLSPDGRMVATCGTDPPLLVQDTGSLEKIAAFGPAGAEQTAIAFSPSGELASADAKGRIAIWDPRSGTAGPVLRESGPAVFDLAFDRTGTRLAAALGDATVVVLDARADGLPDRVLARRAGPMVRSLVCSPVADELLLGCADAQVRLVSIPDLATVREIRNPDDGAPKVAFAPNGKLIAAGGAARLSRVWDASSGELVATLRAPNGAIQSVCFTPDSARLLVIGWWHLHVWDIARQSVVDSFTGYRASGVDVAVSPDGSRAWTNLGQSIRVWDLDPDSGRQRIVSPTSRTLTVFSPTGGLIAGEADGSVSLLADPTGELVATLGKGTRRVRAITLSPVAPIAAAVTVDGTLLLFDLAQGRQIAQWSGFKMPTNDGMRFSSDGGRLVVPAGDDSIRVVSVPDGEVTLTIPSDRSEALAAAFSPDDRMIATSTRRGVICLYDAATGERLRECEAPSSTPWTVVFSPDGRRVLSGNWSRTIDVWSVATGRLERSLDGHRGLVTDLAFRPKEPDILASSGADGQVMLWDLSVPHDTPVLTLEALDGWEVWHLTFDPPGRRLIATNSDGTSVIWDLRHFNRHIGGNMLAWIEQHRAQLGDPFDRKAADEQRRLLLSRGRRPGTGPDDSAAGGEPDRR